MRIRTCTHAVVVAALLGAPIAHAQSAGNVSEYLVAIHQLTESALDHSRTAEAAETVADVKRHADSVVAAVWGRSSGLATARRAAHAYGWKTRWQSDTDDFELETPEKFGTEPPEATDPAKLGIVGRGRYVRAQLVENAQEGNPHYDHVVASLSNVIGWMRIDYADARGGMPRIDLTKQWDAPSEFWQSTADTGWIFDALAQALNILKTDYEGDVATVRRHAEDMSDLLEKALVGLDANGNGSVEPAMMEGGLDTAIQHAGFAGLVQR